MKITLHNGDLPNSWQSGPIVAIDSETLGLEIKRDRLCLVQLTTGDGTVDVVRISQGQSAAPNLCRMLADPQVLKLFHFGRFDIAVLLNAFKVLTAPVYCTKIASRLVRTYTDRHGLKDLVRELLGHDISKEQQSSDWGAALLSEAQQRYAATDVIYLHELKARLDELLLREGRRDLANACFSFLPARSALDLAGWPEIDIFAHS